MIHPARFLRKLSKTGGVALLALSCCACAAPNAFSRLTSSKSAGDSSENGAVQAIYRETTRGQSDPIETPVELPSPSISRLGSRRREGYSHGSPYRYRYVRSHA